MICMIFGENLKELEIQYAEISRHIIEMTKKKSFNIDEYNAFKADKKHLSDQINKIRGKKITEDTDKVKDRKIVSDKKNIDRYTKVKRLIDKDNSLSRSIDRLIYNIKYSAQISNEFSNEKVKIK